MTMIAEHGGKVIPFTDALLRQPKDSVPQDERGAADGPLPDNIVQLARFSRQARRAQRRFWLGGPPEGEAA
jgi:hypothetical protein